MAAPRVTQHELTEAEREIAKQDLGRAESRIEHLEAVLHRVSMTAQVRANVEEELEGAKLERWLLCSILNARQCSCGRMYFTEATQCPRCSAIDAQACSCGKPECRRYEVAF